MVAVVVVWAGVVVGAALVAVRLLARARDAVVECLPDAAGTISPGGPPVDRGEHPDGLSDHGAVSARS